MHMRVQGMCGFCQPFAIAAARHGLQRAEQPRRLLQVQCDVLGHACGIALAKALHIGQVQGRHAVKLARYANSRASTSRTDNGALLHALCRECRSTAATYFRNMMPKSAPARPTCAGGGRVLVLCGLLAALPGMGLAQGTVPTLLVYGDLD